MDYTHDGQQRILALVTLLSGHEITGMTPAEIAKAQGCTPSCVTRDLANLRTAGFAETVPETGRWRLSPTVVQISVRYAAALHRAELRISEIRGRYSREH